MKKNKKRLLIILLAALLLVLFAFATSAEDVAIVDGGTCGSNLTWTLDIEGTLTISGTGSMNNFAFSGRNDIKTVVFGDGVTIIGKNAFYQCTSLTSVTIPNSLTIIGEDAFNGCDVLANIYIKDLASWISIDNLDFLMTYGSSQKKIFLNGTLLIHVVIPEGATSIVNSAFDHCTSLTSVTIPDGVLYIGSNAFSGCTSLTSVTIPDSVKSIGNDVFKDCTLLTSVTIPDGVTYIGSGAFSSCTSLTSVTIPNSVDDFGYSIFSGCTSLTSVTIPNSVTSIGWSTFSGCTSLTSVTIPNSVTSIGNDAFKGCTSLTSMAIPNSVTSIGWSTFSGCTSLTSVTIGDSVTSIGDYAFRDCTALTSVTIPDSVTSIGDEAFGGCSALTSVTIGSGVTSIGYEAYKGCSSLTSVTIPNSVTSIGDEAFSGCASLPSVTIPDSVTSIGYLAFCGCAALTDVTIPNSVTSIGSGVFSGCTALESMTIPDSVTNFGNSVFAGCTALTSATIGNGVTSIGPRSFEGCSSLSSITIGKSVTSFDDLSFLYCNNIYNIYITDLAAWVGISNLSGLLDLEEGVAPQHSLYLNGSLLTNVVIPEGVTTISDAAFFGCVAIKSVTIPNSLTSIGYCAFRGCHDLANICIKDLAAWLRISDLDNLMGEGSSQKKLYLNGTLLTQVVIPDGVTSIPSLAFYDCVAIQNVMIPNSVDSIGYSTFSGCTSLTSVTIPDSVTSIGALAFFGCDVLTDIYIKDLAAWLRISDLDNLMREGSSQKKLYLNGILLTHVVIPDGVTNIPSYAFSCIQSLISVTIPNSLTSIGEKAFMGCNDLANIYIKDLAVWLRISNLDNLMIFGSKQKKLYLNGTLLTYAVIPDGVTIIPSFALSCIQSLKSVTIPDSVASIGYAAFSGCTSLTSVTIGGNVTSIGNYAFSRCTSLTSVTIPNKVTRIGSSTFFDCSGLTSVTIPNSVTIIDNGAFSGSNVISDVYYTGSMAQWNAITIYSGNNSLTRARIHFNGLTESKIIMAKGTSKILETIGLENVSSNQLIWTSDDESIVSVNQNGKVTAQREGLTYVDLAIKNTNYISSCMIIVRGYNSGVFSLGEETYSFHNYGDGNYGFHCAGMAITSSLYHLGLLDRKYLSEKKQALYDYQDTYDVRKVIGYYQGIQGTNLFKSMIAGGNGLLSQAVAERLGTDIVIDPSLLGSLVSMSSAATDWHSIKSVVNTGFFNNSGALTISIQAVKQNEKGELKTIGHTVTFLRYAIVHGQERIYVYDSNMPNKEVYFYMDNDGKIKLSNFPEIKWVFSMYLSDMYRFSLYAKDYKESKTIYSSIGEIFVEGAVASLMSGDYEPDSCQYMYEIPEDSKEVRIAPLTDHAEFTYMGKTYRINKEDENTIGILTLAKTEEGEGTLKVVNDPDNHVHIYSSVLTKEVTCSEDGIITYYCARCNDQKTITISSYGHLDEDGDGLCDFCQNSMPPHEHSYISIITKLPSCAQTGALTTVCNLCGDSYTETVPATGNHVDIDDDNICDDCGGVLLIEEHTHQYTSTITLHATCTEPGEATYTCTACGDTYTEPIPATGDHVDEDNDGLCDGCNKQMRGGGRCKYCGQIHKGFGGFFTKIIHWFLGLFGRTAHEVVS